MSSRAPFSLSPALLAVRILLCAAFLPSGIRDLGTLEYTGAEAVQVRRLLNPVPDKPESQSPDAPEDVTPASLRQENPQAPAEKVDDASSVTASHAPHSVAPSGQLPPNAA